MEPGHWLEFMADLIRRFLGDLRGSLDLFGIKRAYPRSCFGPCLLASMHWPFT